MDSPAECGPEAAANGGGPADEAQKNDAEGSGEKIAEVRADSAASPASICIDESFQTSPPPPARQTPTKEAEQAAEMPTEQPPQAAVLPMEVTAESKPPEGPTELHQEASTSQPKEQQPQEEPMAVDPPKEQAEASVQPSTSAVASTSADPPSSSNEKPADADRKPSCSLPSLIVRKVHGKNIAVSKADYEIANAYGFNPFCVVALETPDFSALFPKHKRKEKKTDGEEPRSKKPKPNEPTEKPRPESGKQRPASELIALGRPPIEKPKKTAKAESAVAQPPPADKPTSSRAAAAAFKPKRIKIITANCKTCSKPMDQRTFMPESETFYCSTECIHDTVKRVRKTLNPRDQLFLTDRKGRLHANLAHINNLETFLLQKPYFEPCVKTNENEEARPDAKEREVRALVRERITKELRTRCQFHDVEIAEKPLKELSFQIEMDLHRLIADVKDVRYRSWCQVFIKHVMNSGKSFIDKLIGRVVTSAHLTSIPYAQLDAELHRLDEIEAAADANGAENSASSTPSSSKMSRTDAKPDAKPKPALLPFRRAAPLPRGAPTAATTSKPRAEVGRSAIDDILGSGENTTSKHSSHLYDASCDICKQKDQREAMMLEKMQKTEEKNRMESIPRKRDRQAMSNGGYAEPSPQQGGSSAGDPWGGGGDDGEPSGSSPMGRPAFSAYDRPSFFPRGPPTKTPVANFHSPEGAAPVYPARREPPPVHRAEPPMETWRPPPPIAALNPKQKDGPRNQSIDHIWCGGFEYYQKFSFRCNLGLLHNRGAALELRNELPDHLDMCGTVDCTSVYREFEMASTQWNKQIIALVMHPPSDDRGYRQYIDLFNECLHEGRMVKADVERIPSLENLYFFSLPPRIDLPPSCCLGEGPGITPQMREAGNVVALITRYANRPAGESWREPPQPTALRNPASARAGGREFEDLVADAHARRFPPPLGPPTVAPVHRPPPPLQPQAASEGEHPMDGFVGDLEVTTPPRASPSPPPVDQADPLGALQKLDGMNDLLVKISKSPVHSPTRTPAKPKKEFSTEDEMVDQMIADAKKMPFGFVKLRVQLLKLKSAENAKRLAAAYFSYFPSSSDEHKYEAKEIIRSKNRIATVTKTEEIRPRARVDLTGEPIPSPPPPPPPEPEEDHESVDMSTSDDEDEFVQALTIPPPPMPPSALDYGRGPVDLNANRPLPREPPPPQSFYPPPQAMRAPPIAPPVHAVPLQRPPFQPPPPPVPRKATGANDVVMGPLRSFGGPPPSSGAPNGRAPMGTADYRSPPRPPHPMERPMGGGPESNENSFATGPSLLPHPANKHSSSPIRGQSIIVHGPPRPMGGNPPPPRGLAPPMRGGYAGPPRLTVPAPFGGAVRPPPPRSYLTAPPMGAYAQRPLQPQPRMPVHGPPFGALPTIRPSAPTRFPVRGPPPRPTGGFY